MLVTLDDMKDYLGIPLIDTTYDNFLTDQIEVVSSAIEGYCGRKFEVATYTQTFYKDEIRQLKKEVLLYHYPIVSVTSVNEDGVAVSECRVIPYTGTLVNPNYFFNGEVLEVVYTAGYSVIPKPIVSVVRSLVEERYNKKVAGVDINFGSDIQGISIPGTISIQYDYTLQANDRATSYGMILGNYVNVLGMFRSERVLIGTIGNQYVV